MRVQPADGASAPPPHQGHPGVRRGLTMTLAHRLWSVLQGPVTVALLAATLTPADQGLWYALVALARWQTLGDLGFGALLQQFASHEAALPESAAARRRLGSLLRIATGYAGIVGAGMLALLLAGGSSVLEVADAPGLQTAWAALAVLTVVSWAGTLAVLPVVEGSGAVATAAGVRLAQSAGGRIAAWAILLNGGGWWGLAAERLVSIAVLATAVFASPVFASPVLAGPVLAGRASLGARWRDGASGGVSYRREMLPLAWRTALGTLGGFVPWAIAVPGALVWLGAAEAGRLGLGLSVLGSFGSVWDGVVHARVPMLAMRAARAEHREADREWLRVGGLACVGFAACGVLFALSVSAWHAGALPHGDRLPDVGVAWLLVLGAAVRFGRGQVLVWARTHKREPFWALDIASGLASIVILPFAAQAGLAAMIAAWLAVDVGVLFATIAGAVAFARGRAPPAR